MQVLAQSEGGGVFSGILVFIAVAYFIPTVVAIARGALNKGSVAVINLLLGWTVIGWIVSLAMAFGNNRPVYQQNYQQLQPGWHPTGVPNEGRWWDGQAWGATGYWWNDRWNSQPQDRVDAPRVEAGTSRGADNDPVEHQR